MDTVNNTHTDDDVRAYATIKIDNNTPGVISELNKNGFNISGTAATRKDLGAALFTLYKQNKTLFLSVLQNVPFNAFASNYTTQPEFIKQVSDLTTEIKSL
jgi:lipid II:glycine glycyltransferase (peptidoglycan interpeptide bridge formation enzyme)